ncbi:hypothetical protein B9Z55_000038 [Caenorhabditis nigoni]|uniref:NTF2-like domain-containing protein n=1 Tax=Caenorhabditis nigoni TaxID=1611254 RepID=A0A2G5VS90_9PELO|nr:hypothetical protein B9Z55_000038 [Caenorhabditis nigoni]
MWKKSSILLLLLVGASWAFVPDDPEFTFFGSDGPVEVAKRFLDRIKRSVDSKDVAVISGLFNPGFEFKGCKGDYNKAKVVGILSHLPAGTPFSMTLQSAVTLGTVQIKYSVSVSGFGPSSIIAEFILNIHDQQLQSGSIPACQHLMGFFRNFVASTPEEQVKAFLDRMKAAITSRDSSALLNLFQFDFKFIGCKATYDRDQSVAMFMEIPEEAHLDYKFKAVQDLGDSIKAIVIAEGLKATIHVEFEFVLSKKDQKIEKASMICPKPDIRAFMGQEDSPMEVAQKFLDRMKKSVDSQDVAVISGLFNPGFEFKGCRGTHNKEQVVGFLSHLNSDNFHMTLKSAVSLETDQLKYTVAISRFGPRETIAEFILNIHGQQLQSGNVPACQRKGFARTLGSRTPPKWLVCEQTASSFVDAMRATIKSQDEKKIGALFSDKFRLHGYQVVSKLSHLMPNTDFHFFMISNKCLPNNEIEIVIRGSAFGYRYLEVSLVFSQTMNVLVRAERNKCPNRPTRALTGGVVNDNPMEVAQKFLDRIKRSVDSRDVAVISGLFNPGFEFKGCKGNYNKVKVVGHLSHLPAGTPFSMTLQSAITLRTDQIKYSVSVSGFGPSPIIAEFILNIHDQQLQSGSIPACQHLMGFFRNVASSTPAEQVKAFLDRMKAAITSRDSPALLNLFQPNFKFIGCKATYDRDQSVAMFMEIPEEAHLDYKFKSVQDIGDSIEAVVIAEGLKATIHVEFEFVLSKKDQKIEKASMVCPKRRRLFQLVNPAKVGIKGKIDNFLDELTKDIETGNAILIGTHFDEGFEYEGMKGTYNKRQLVGILSRLPHNHQFSFKLHKIGPLQKDNEVDIGVTVTGLGPAPFETSFVLDTRIFSLKSGKYLKNEKGSVHRVFSGEVRKPLGRAEEMVHDFLDRVTKATASKIYEEISGLFEDSFVFKGCRGKYTKEQAIKILCQLPPGTKFTINLMEVNDQESTIKYTVQIIGMGEVDMQVEFVLNKNSQKLVSGGIPLCQDSQLDSNSIAEQFLAKMRPVVDSGDAAKLASFFADDFMFTKCDGKDESKDAVIGLIGKSPFSVSLNFVSSKFLSDRHIELFVDISAGFLGTWRTVFLLDFTENVLVRGKLLSC